MAPVKTGRWSTVDHCTNVGGDRPNSASKLKATPGRLLSVWVQSGLANDAPHADAIIMGHVSADEIAAGATDVGHLAFNAQPTVMLKVQRSLHGNRKPAHPLIVVSIGALNDV